MVPLRVLDRIKNVRAHIDNKRKNYFLPYGIEEIKEAIVANSHIDEICFIPFDDPENHVKGRYQRYSKSPGVYCDSVLQVDIHYNKSLNFCWTRFVICKEMCHSLEDGGDEAVSTREDVDSLVDALLSPKQLRQSVSFFPPFISENVAQFAALELLCPLPLRKKIVEYRSSTTLSDMQIATDFRIPVDYVDILFNKNYIDLVEEAFVKSASL